MAGIHLPFPFPLTAEAIVRMRAQILSRLLVSDPSFCAIPVQGISQQTLDLMLELYDSLFLCETLKPLNIRVTLSSRLTSTAGKFLWIRGAFGKIKQAEIRLSSDFLLRLNHGPFELNGLSVSTPQEAFLLVFEHELCHSLEVRLHGQTGHSERFKALAQGLFGHKGTRHKLPTRRQEAAQNGLLIGSRVSFPYQNQMLTGIVTYIGKTATVMVPSLRGAYRDKRGTRYEKYRVPLNDIVQI